jgi:hypothetical protein
MSFANDVKKISNKLETRIESVARGIIIDLFNGIIRDTRVGNADYWKRPVAGYVGGRLRGNWQTTVNRPATGELDRKDTIRDNKDGGQAQAEVTRKVDGLKVNYLTNNLPYVLVMEENDAMVAKNIARIKRITKKNARNL